MALLDLPRRTPLIRTHSGSNGAAGSKADRQPGRLARRLLLLLAAAAATGLVLSATTVLNQRQRQAHLADLMLPAAAAGGGSGDMGALHAQSKKAASCGHALQVPQVAMLFLVKGDLRHEALWHRWFERVEGLLPEQAVRSALCSGGAAKRVPKACSHGWWPSAEPAGGGPLHRQHLFDVYVHPAPNFTGYAPGSLLFGRELPKQQRVAAEWGTHALMHATEALLAAALKNPRNQRFMLLSESDLPLYSPQALYLQLMSEERSRINACNTTQGWDLNLDRWRDAMATPFLHKGLWRKSWQWWALNRKHAELVVRDRRVEKLFEAHCFTYWQGEDEHACYSDEHYIPTLLAVEGLEGESDCQGQYMHVDWERAKESLGWAAHPWEYTPAEINATLFASLRRPHLPECRTADSLLAAAPAAFAQQEQLLGAGDKASAVCEQLRQQAQGRPQFQGIGPQCPLMARKFLNGTEQPTLKALVPCDSPALILNDGRCSTVETPQQHDWHMLWLRLAPTLMAYSSALLALALLSLWAPMRSLPHRVHRAARQALLLLRKLPHLLLRRRGARVALSPRPQP